MPNSLTLSSGSSLLVIFSFYVADFCCHSFAPIDVSIQWREKRFKNVWVESFFTHKAQTLTHSLLYPFISLTHFRIIRLVFAHILARRRNYYKLSIVCQEEDEWKMKRIKFSRRKKVCSWSGPEERIPICDVPNLTSVSLTVLHPWRKYEKETWARNVSFWRALCSAANWKTVGRKEEARVCEWAKES